MLYRFQLQLHDFISLLSFLPCAITPPPPPVLIYKYKHFVHAQSTPMGPRLISVRNSLFTLVTETYFR
jgi:hypothetical protein